MYSTAWPQCPTIYEINTWVWLADLSAKYRTFMELGSVPSQEWDAIAEFGFDGVWLMGVWKRGAAGIACGNADHGLLEHFRCELPDLHAQDNVGSPYCVRRYEVDEFLGGPRGLAVARKELAKRGIRLILDFVPNHVACEHAWSSDHPEYFIQGGAEDARNKPPPSYLQVGGRAIARGRDCDLSVWPDSLQLNAFHPGLRQAMRETVVGIARQCDGIQCDMAMLLENSMFERTWGSRAGERPATEYWVELIQAVKRAYPGLLFIAEAHWEWERDLHYQGFDFCYDKRLYDRLKRGGAESVRVHLSADFTYQKKLVRFIENHDGPRAAATFSPAKERATAIMMATLPGARLFHEGQFEGRKVRLPLHIGRRPIESKGQELREFYQRLLKSVDCPLFHDGQWSLCERTGLPSDSNFQNLVAWSWVNGDPRCLVMVNLSDQTVQARVQVPWKDGFGETWVLDDTLSGTTLSCDGDEIQTLGLYVELGPWNGRVFQCYRSHRNVMAAAA